MITSARFQIGCRIACADWSPEAGIRPARHFSTTAHDDLCPAPDDLERDRGICAPRGFDRPVGVFEPAPIPASNRLAEADFWKAFEADYSRILGVCSTSWSADCELSKVQLSELPRMADYARWGEAIGCVLGWRVSAFTTTYDQNRELANAPAMQDSLVATTLLEVGPRLQGFWGGPVELLRELTIHLGQKEAEMRQKWGPAGAREWSANWARWPKEPRQFSKELRRVLPSLRAYGITAEFYPEAGGSVLVSRIHRRTAPTTWPTCEQPLNEASRPASPAPPVVRS